MPPQSSRKKGSRPQSPNSIPSWGRWVIGAVVCFLGLAVFVLSGAAATLYRSGFFHTLLGITIVGALVWWLVKSGHGAAFISSFNSPASPGGSLSAGSPPGPPAIPRLSPNGFRGPPYDCWHCGGSFRTVSVVKNQGSGCLLIIIGICFAPFLIGIPVLIYGFYIWGQTDKFLQCTRCGTQAPR